MSNLGLTAGQVLQGCLIAGMASMWKSYFVPGISAAYGRMKAASRTTYTIPRRMIEETP